MTLAEHAGRGYYSEQLPMIGEDGTPLFGTPEAETPKPATASYLASDGLGERPYEEQTGGSATYERDEANLPLESAAALARQGLGGRSRIVQRGASIHKDTERAGAQGSRGELSDDEVAKAALVYQEATQQNMGRYTRRIETNAIEPTAVVLPDGSIPRIDPSKKGNPAAAMIRARRERDEANRAGMHRQHQPVDESQ